ncbi:MAG: 16S rRNA (cytosine(967)-C(5))-methyltransferase RsmB [Gammaproteobacteria bacterium]|nr:16S rRNA (cytosine(967)-C(5))-methyltransferase RsmB [Gammaproteobacteria bacterium]
MNASPARTKADKDRLHARQAALAICLALLQQRQSLTALLATHTKRLANAQERALCSELCYGFCRYYFVLRRELAKRLSKPLKSRDRDIEVILLLGLYQLRFTRIGDHAAVNETVNLIARRKKAWARGLVNAVLRSYQREVIEPERDTISSLSGEEQALAYPEWIRAKIRQDWPEQADSIYRAGNQRPPMVLRVDLERLSREEYRQLLAGQGIDSRPHPQVASALQLAAAVEVESLPGFAEGWVSVQDAAAQLAAVLLQAERGMRVLDACAAPGGKTLHILQHNPGVELIALDKDAERLPRVAQNLQRAGVEAQLICADAANTDDWFDGAMFDRILLDAPCSASGIMRRHPDIRLLREAEDVPALVQQQQRLLTAMWQLLKPGGQLLYSTCSLFKDENEAQVEHFLQNCGNGVELPLNHVQWGIERPLGRQVLPGQLDMDGFYYARLLKQD